MAARLKQARELRHYTSARSAAKAMGELPETYANHENGNRGYPVAKARKYATYYKVNLAWLLSGRGSPTGRGDPAETIFHELDETSQAEALRYLEYLRANQQRSR